MSVDVGDKVGKGEIMSSGIGDGGGGGVTIHFISVCVSHDFAHCIHLRMDAWTAAEAKS